MKFTSIHNKTKECMMNMKQQYIEMSGKSFDRFVKKNDIYGLIKNNPEKADIIVINTCGFIASAKEEAINTILIL